MQLAGRATGCHVRIPAPQTCASRPKQHSRLLVAAGAARGDGAGGGAGDGSGPGLGLKAVWHGAETLGNIIGASKGLSSSSSSGGDGSGSSSSGSVTAVQAARTREQAVAAIKDDYAVNYFVSGAGAMEAYAPDCEFADPFASFRGTQRFKNNVGNLGGLLRDIQLDIRSFEEGPGPDEVTTRWAFSAILDLPWRPRLAAAGGTTHVLDPRTNLVVRHIERWEVEPGQVVASLLRPSAKVPATFAEVFMRCLSSGDALGLWYCLSSGVARVALPLSVGLALLHLGRGEGLGAWEAAAYCAFVAGLGTEMWKVVQNIVGGESG